VLGTPLITDSFHADRWDYVFRRQRANSRELEQRKIAVFFEDGKLKRIEGDVTPAANADAAGGKPPEPQPVAGTSAEPKAAAAEAADAAKPAKVEVQQPGAAPADQLQEKSWWQRLKDKF